MQSDDDEHNNNNKSDSAAPQDDMRGAHRKENAHKGGGDGDALAE